ncbi:lysM domain-containing GPI-anchored protein 2 [Telopea speciosissima]|uniref:lysM domain-containing GPI-anchored protein 2 n=1 Tax=Telopea speciosissima TaxID=54955 RepID=UPI001CC43611|nr:lysM domain-containing GPI-anchored protein 2 [Telopea speciosissima]
MEMRGFCSAALLLSLTFALFSALIVVPSTALGFTCSSSTTTCESLIDYVSPNDTTLANIASLFSVTNFYNLLGANSYPLSTSPNQSFAANNTIKIPFPCSCSNGTGISNKVPVYTVQPGDNLDHIAVDVYSRLVTYQEIAQVNNIADPSLIQLGQKLWIPLQCSCDKVGGNQVVHYGYVVANGSTVSQIAAEYGTDVNTLLSLNGMSSANQLLANQVLDVPLKVCTSSVSGKSQDYPLLVANGTYTLTAYNCIKCSCQSSNNFTLQCEPSQLVKPSNISQCPSMKCNDGLLIGNTSSCVTCAYAGYYNTTILSTLNNLNTGTCSAFFGRIFDSHPVNALSFEK